MTNAPHPTDARLTLAARGPGRLALGLLLVGALLVLLGVSVLVVSQFTLAADTQKGLRPSFSSAKPPAEAEQLYDYFLQQARLQHGLVASGRFGADMQVTLVNDGPVTFLLHS